MFVRCLFRTLVAVTALVTCTEAISPLIAAEPPADAGNWTQWRGPDRDGISKETGLIRKWPEDGPKVIWHVDSVGVGYSSIAIKDGRIYTQGDLNGVEHIISLDAKDGRVLWAVQPGPVAKRLEERVANEFKQLDQNENGQIDEEEALARLGWNFNESDRPVGDDPQKSARQRTERLLKSLDKNSDNQLTFDEALGFGNDFSRIDSTDKDADAAALAKQRTAAFLKQLDADSDKRISREEAKRTLLERIFGNVEVRDQVDPNNPNNKRGDDFLTAAELQDYFVKQEAGKDGIDTAEELQAFFASRFPNRDGILDQDELRGHFGGYRNGQGDGPRGTPTIEGDRVYTEGGNGDLTCSDAKTGETVWYVNLVDDLGGGRPGWGYSESPLIEGDLLIVTPGGPKGTLAALNKLTGEVVWRSTETTQAAHYASPVAADIGGIREFVQFARESCFGVEAATGKLMWEYKAANNGTANCSTPIVYKDHVFASSSYGTGGGLAKIITSGGEQTAEQVYFDKSMADHHGGTILVGDYLYSIGAGTLICMNYLTGEIAWQDRSVGKGSLVVADGMLFVLSEGHQVGLAEVSPKGYNELGKFRIESHGRPSWAHPVVAGGRLYLRDQSSLTAYDLVNE